MVLKKVHQTRKKRTRWMRTVQAKALSECKFTSIYLHKVLNYDGSSAHFLHAQKNQHVCSVQLHTSQLLHCFQCSALKTKHHWVDTAFEGNYCFFDVDLNVQWLDMFNTCSWWHNTFLSRHIGQGNILVYMKGHGQQHWGGLSLELNPEHLHWALTAQSWDTFSCQDPKMF